MAASPQVPPRRSEPAEVSQVGDHGEQNLRPQGWIALMVQEVETPAHEQKRWPRKPSFSCHASGAEERPTSEVRATILFMSEIHEKEQLRSFKEATLSTQERSQEIGDPGQQEAGART